MSTSDGFPPSPIASGQAGRGSLGARFGRGFDRGERRSAAGSAGGRGRRSSWRPCGPFTCARFLAAPTCWALPLSSPRSAVLPWGRTSDTGAAEVDELVDLRPGGEDIAALLP